MNLNVLHGALVLLMQNHHSLIVKTGDPEESYFQVHHHHPQYTHHPINFHPTNQQILFAAVSGDHLLKPHPTCIFHPAEV